MSLNMIMPAELLALVNAGMRDVRAGKEGAPARLADTLEIVCTTLCIGDESYARHVDAEGYAVAASNLLRLVTGRPESGKAGSNKKKQEAKAKPTASAVASALPFNVSTLTLRFIGLLVEIVPTGALALAEPQHEVAAMLGGLLGDVEFLLESGERAEEVLKCVQGIAPHAHSAFLNANVLYHLCTVEPILDDFRLRLLCLTSINEFLARSHHSEWRSLRPAVVIFLDNFAQRVHYHFPLRATNSSGPTTPGAALNSPTLTKAKRSRRSNSAASSNHTNPDARKGDGVGPSSSDDHGGDLRTEGCSSIGAFDTGRVRKPTKQDQIILGNYVVCAAQLCDRVLTTPSMLKKALLLIDGMTRDIVHLLKGVIAHRDRSEENKEEAGSSSPAAAKQITQQLRFIALSPLVTLYFTSPAIMTGVFVRNAVLEVASSAAAQILDQSSVGATADGDGPLSAATAAHQVPTATAPANAGEPANPNASDAAGGENGNGPSTTTNAANGAGDLSIDDGPLGPRLTPPSNSLLLSSINSGASRSRPLGQLAEEGLLDGDSGSTESSTRADPTADAAAAAASDAEGSSNSQGNMDAADDNGSDGSGEAQEQTAADQNGAQTDSKADETSFVADERAVIPMTEFLLTVLPPAPFGHSTDDFLNLTFPQHGWAWHDDFHNPTECGERISRLMGQLYANYRDSCLSAKSLHRVPLERQVTLLSLNALRKIFVNLTTQEFACSGNMFPHAFQRRPVFVGYVHGRQEGLTGVGACGACRCVTLTEAEKTREFRATRDGARKSSKGRRGHHWLGGNNSASYDPTENGDEGLSQHSAVGDLNALEEDNSDRSIDVDVDDDGAAGGGHSDDELSSFATSAATSVSVSHRAGPRVDQSTLSTHKDKTGRRSRRDAANRTWVGDLYRDTPRNRRTSMVTDIVAARLRGTSFEENDGNGRSRARSGPTAGGVEDGMCGGCCVADRTANAPRGTMEGESSRTVLTFDEWCLADGADRDGPGSGASSTEGAVPRREGGHGLPACES